MQGGGKSKKNEIPVLVFTDAAFEQGVATCGAAIVDKGFKEAFGCTIPAGLVAEWT